MTNSELSQILREELDRRSWTVSDLARATGMNRETVRRAVLGIGSTALETANILLAALKHELIVEVSQ